MRIAVVTNYYEHSIEIGKQLKQKLQAASLTLDEVNPQIVITVGGDGTLLYAFHKYEKQLDSICFIGVHTGHLGFYTDWRDNELDELVRALTKECPTTISYPLLDVEVCADGIVTSHIALNEMTIRRINHTVVSDVRINGRSFERFRGDGLIVSTPTGSTGYNKSMGGSVIPPHLEVFQMTEMAPLNNRVFHTLGSPMILGKEDRICLHFTEGDDYILTIDNEKYPLTKVDWIRIRISNRRIQFMKQRHLPFWQRVHQSFLGDDSCD